MYTEGLQGPGTFAGVAVVWGLAAVFIGALVWRVKRVR